MCILFIHADPNPKEGGYRFIVATNRDEYYERPAAVLSEIDDTIIGGQDMEPGREGGMWLGVSTKGQKGGKGRKFCFAALLNLTGDHVQSASGRGFIVKDFLKFDGEFSEYAEKLEKKQYSGYNVVAAELSKEHTQIFHHSNKPVMTSFYPGQQSLAFGNSPIYVPYKKVSSGRYKFLEILEKSLPEEDLVNELLALLKDSTSYLPDVELERRSPSANKFLSSIFVRTDPPVYGTRTHSIILIDSDWNLKFIEHTMEEPIDGNNPKWIINKYFSKL